MAINQGVVADIGQAEAETIALGCAVFVGVGTALLVLRFLMRKLLGTIRSFSVSGVHCLVTGGSSGIGKEVAKQLMREGAHVTIAARRQDVLDEALKEIAACRVSKMQMVQTVSVDVGNAEQVEKVMAEAVAKQGPVRLLANCAGFAIAREFDKTDMADFERILRVNTLGTAYVTRTLLPVIKAAGGGRIVFTSSMLGQTGIYGYAAYSASKFALVGMAQALQMEVKAYDIGVSVVYPPDTNTPGFTLENEGKPVATRRISAGGGLFYPAQVAAKIVRGVKRGDFCISVGMDGYLLALGTQGFSPCFSVGEAIMQVLSASVLRASSLFYSWSFYRIAAEEKVKETKGE